MIVAGIDASLTSAGVAVLTDGQPAHLSHHGFGGDNHPSDQKRSRRIRYQERLIHQAATSQGRPDLVLIERPLTIIKSAKVFDRYELCQRLYGDFDWQEIPVLYVHNTTAKKWISGRGDAQKPQIVAAVQSWYPTTVIANDDEADALGIATIGAFHVGDPVPFLVKDRHHIGLEKVAWPSNLCPKPDKAQVTA